MLPVCLEMELESRVHIVGIRHVKAQRRADAVTSPAVSRYQTRGGKGRRIGGYGRCAERVTPRLGEIERLARHDYV